MEDSVFDSWDHWPYDPLRRAAVLADAENEKPFYCLPDQLSDQPWVKFQDIPRYGYEKEDKLVHY